MYAVIDTNILVSAMWNSSGKASNTSRILWSIFDGYITPYYDERMMKEYIDVLNRTKFNFPVEEIKLVLDVFHVGGIYVVPDPLPGVVLKDESDRAFYETAKFCGVPLVTGNLKHFPPDPDIMTPADFCAQCLAQ